MNNEVEEDDDSWLDPDPEWEAAHEVWKFETKLKIQRCIDMLDRIIIRNGYDIDDEDDILEEFVISNS